MANTHELIRTITLTGTQANIDFTSIPQTYTDLKMVFSCRSNDTQVNGGNFFYFQFNNTGFTGLSGKYMGSNATSTNTGTSSPYGFMVPSDFTANVFSSGEFYMPGYTSSNNKTYAITSANENNATLTNMNFFGGTWANTAAVTSIKLVPYSGSFVQHTSASLYGIKNT